MFVYLMMIRRGVDEGQIKAQIAWAHPQIYFHIYLHGMEWNAKNTQQHVKFYCNTFSLLFVPQLCE